MERVFQRFPRIKERLNQSGGTLSGGDTDAGDRPRPDGQARTPPAGRAFPGPLPEFCRTILETIQELREKDGYTLLLVEQNANQALNLADRGYVLETGQVVLQGTCQALRDNEQLQIAYLGKGVRNP